MLDQKPYIETPLIKSPYLSDITNCNVYLKLENTQPSGSFKSRGIGHWIQTSLKQNSNSKVYSSSGGNAGLAAATAAKLYNVKCTVVVPTTIKPGMVKRLEKIGATVIVHGNHWAQADEYLRQLMKEDADPSIYCHPFDNPVIWEGHSSMVVELKAEMKDNNVDYVVLSCGGGGLLCGVAQGLDNNNMKDTKIVVSETEGAPSLNKSLEKGKLVTLDKIDTIANTLGASRVAERAFDIGQQDRTTSTIVSDKQATSATRQFADDHKFIVEPACGAALAICYSNKFEFPEGSNVIVVLCGGTSTTVDALVDY